MEWWDEYGQIVEQRAVGIQQLTLEVKLLAVGNSTVKAKRAAEAEAREFGFLVFKFRNWRIKVKG